MIETKHTLFFSGDATLRRDMETGYGDCETVPEDPWTDLMDRSIVYFRHNNRNLDLDQNRLNSFDDDLDFNDEPENIGMFLQEGYNILPLGKKSRNLGRPDTDVTGRS